MAVTKHVKPTENVGLVTSTDELKQKSQIRREIDAILIL